MKKVLISLPIEDKEDVLIERRIQRIKRIYCNFLKVNPKKIQFVDLFHICYSLIKNNEDAVEELNKQKEPDLIWLGASIVGMSDIDEIVFSNDWKKSRRCRFEEMIAKEYGIPMIKLDDVMKEFKDDFDKLITIKKIETEE